MANRERGEFTLVGGDNERYRLRLTTNACAEVEDVAGGRTWDQVMAGIQKGSVKDVRIFLWAALREYHPDVATDHPASLKAVGRLIDRAGGLDGIYEQITAFAKLNEDPADVKESTTEDKDGRPPLPAPAAGAELVGTGVNSTSTPES